MTLAGTVVLVDAADATSSGASGDSTEVAAAVLAAGYAGRLLAPVVDPEAVARAVKAGIGATVTVSLGGGLDPRFTPLQLTARVRQLSDGEFVSEDFRAPWHAGRCAVLEARAATFVVTCRAVNLSDRRCSWLTARNSDGSGSWW